MEPAPLAHPMTPWRCVRRGSPHARNSSQFTNSARSHQGGHSRTALQALFSLPLRTPWSPRLVPDGTLAPW